MESANGRVERVVSVIALNICSTSGHRLAQIGKYDHGKFEASCQLPGGESSIPQASGSAATPWPRPCGASCQRDAVAGRPRAGHAHRAKHHGEEVEGVRRGNHVYLLVFAPMQLYMQLYLLVYRARAACVSSRAPGGGASALHLSGAAPMLLASRAGHLEVMRRLCDPMQLCMQLYLLVLVFACMGHIMITIYTPLSLGRRQAMRAFCQPCGRQVMDLEGEGRATLYGS
jgi:hypothetical protein